ncbi:MAG: hypothetical protein GY710_14730 [Desulfobacteraceae bacterium]|nr:hypothetical protein [Desulfobacteraceae bacterium]
MREKFDLEQMLKEISQEDTENDKKKKKLSQDDIKKMLAKRRKGVRE